MIKNFRQAYDFVYGTYSKSTREKLLEFIGKNMSEAELQSYENTPQIELAEIYSFNIARQMQPKDTEGIQIVYNELKKKQETRRKSGLGNPPLTIRTDGGHIGQIVGDELVLSKKWKTFHDFLLEYITLVLGREWGAKELKKSPEERHQIINLFEKLRSFQKENFDKEKESYRAIATAPAAAYLRIAYDLYVLKHNVGLQSFLIDRLKQVGLFQGARYELYVAASLIKAGFIVEYIDETDKTKTSCEYIATHKETGKKYSVEAKSKHRNGVWGYKDEKQKNPLNLNINRLIKDAIEKEADYPKIIFVDVNLPLEPGEIFEKPWAQKVISLTNKLEARPYAENKAAYIFYTNHPHGHCKDNDIDPGAEVLMTTIGIPDFLVNDEETTRKNHREICRLCEFMTFHSEIPQTFEEIVENVRLSA